jgi:hypothetical protein
LYFCVCVSVMFGFIPTARITYVGLCCKVVAVVNLKSYK